MEFVLKSFDELTTHELYQIMSIRQEVFVVEQNCPYQDADGKDSDSLHLSVYMGEELIAYARLVPRGLSYADHSSIGRVLNLEKYRGQSIGKKLMEVAIGYNQEKWPNIPIKISAQKYLLSFYQSLGFEQVGEEYLEDDIPHVAMIYSG